MAYLLIIAAIFIADLILKSIVEKKCRLGEKISCCHGKVIIEKYYNRGFALNKFEKYPKLVAYGPAVFCVGLFCRLLWLLATKGCKGMKLALSMVIGGAVSNIYDRFTKHYVVDYIRFGAAWKWLRKIVFNISDFFIILGTILLVFFQEIKINWQFFQNAGNP